MRANTVLAIVVTLLTTSTLAQAGTPEQSLMKLDPEERARQACILKGMDTIRRDKRLPRADRLQASISAPASLVGNVVMANGAAIRSKGHWFEMTFTCAVTADLLKATSFTYELGREIPAAQWDDLGLW